MPAIIAYCGSFDETLIRAALAAHGQHVPADHPIPSSFYGNERAPHAHTTYHHYERGILVLDSCDDAAVFLQPGASCGDPSEFLIMHFNDCTVTDACMLILFR